MMWEGLTLVVLLIAAMLVYVARVVKRTLERKRQEQAPAAGIPLSPNRRVSYREPHRPSQRRGGKQPHTDGFAVGHNRRLRIDVTAESMRRGMILMLILEPCRGDNPYRFPG